MPALTDPRWEKFAQLMAAGRNDQKTCGILAGYPAKTAKQAACRLAKKPKVRARIEELQERGAKAATKSIADIVRQLDLDRDLAHKEGQAGAAVSASMGQAKVLGLIVDKSIQAVKRYDEMSEADLRAFLGLGPDDPLPDK